MENRFFEKPILNSPYEYPVRHWELDHEGQPTQLIIPKRRLAEFITPIPKPRKRKGSPQQQQMIFDEGKGLSTEKQQYDPTPIINELRQFEDQWRALQNPNNWQVTPETARLLQHTSTSKLVYDYISGFQRENEDGSATLENGRLALFRNFDEHGNPIARPRTLLIDSEQLESGDALDDNFRTMASDEIERFRREIIERTGDRKQAEKLTDQDLLREVMNTPRQVWPPG